MIGTLAVSERTALVRPQGLLAEPRPTPAAFEPAFATQPDAIEVAAPRLLPSSVPAGVDQRTTVQRLRLAQASGGDTAGFREVQGRYRIISDDLDEGMPAALLAAAGGDARRSVSAFDTYLEGQRVDVPQAAILAAAGVAHRFDTGEALAAYRSFVRYDGLSPSGAAVLASTRMRTHGDLDAIYRTFRAHRDSGLSEPAAVALASAELESGRTDAANQITPRLRGLGFSADDAAFVASAMLRSSNLDVNVASAANVALRRSYDVPLSVRPTLVAASIASGKPADQMAAAYDWFLRNASVQEHEAAILAAGWALRGGDAVGTLTGLSLRGPSVA